MQTSKPANDHACPHCDHSCKIRSVLRRHNREVHVTGKLYSCSSCDKSFFRKLNIDSHKKTCSMDGSCIRRHLVQNFWLPVLDDLLPCMRDEDNKDGATAVTIMSDDLVSGYILKTISYICVEFRRNGTIKAIITDSHIDRGHGMEFSVDYIFNVPRKCICKVICELNNN